MHLMQRRERISAVAGGTWQLGPSRGGYDARRAAERRPQAEGPVPLAEGVQRTREGRWRHGYSRGANFGHAATTEDMLYQGTSYNNY